jgi:wyosine [tRNA(Phe)-imidazoG37] synthetase (radical SAM superfamily)
MANTFGPIPSRRFGMSLGIDLSSNIKQCNFDCLYCELAPAKTVEKQSVSIDPQTIFLEVKEALENHPNMAKDCTAIDVITFTANGEPTLYPYLDELIDKIDTIKGSSKTLILSNGANIYNKQIQNTLKKIDIVKLSLDCISPKIFKKLDREDSSVDSQKILEGICEFRNVFNKELVLETLFVKDINDSDEEINLLVNAYKKTGANRIDIGTIDRPPAYDVKPISFEILESIANRCDELPVTIAFRNKPNANNSFNEEEILNLIKMRPLTLEDIQNTFDEKSQELFEKLLSEEKISKVLIAGVEFYK